MYKKKFALTRKELVMTTIAMFVLFAAASVLCYFLYAGESQFGTWQFIRFFGVYLLLIAAFAIYLYCDNVEVLKDHRKLYSMCGIMLFGLAIFVVLDRFVSDYAVPYAFVALTCGLIISRKTGFMSSLVVVVMMFFAQAFSDATTSLIPLFEGIVQSLVASYMLSKQTKRINYIGVAAGLSVFACLSNLMFTLADGVAEINYLMLVVYSLLSGIAAVAMFMIATPVLDSIFNLITDFRLAELTATDAPLLKKMFEEAPGTFNHCLTVANYAEACASAIGENTYLARAAAYYHDIGKLKNPQYFKENQMDGHNPHDEITPELSTALIKKHVSNGMILAKEYHLPESVSIFIQEHHGTMPIQFFYSKAQKYTDGRLDDIGFRYDGPTPSNKISAILMVCDSSEAALRALAPDDRQKADQIVTNILNDRIKYRQFDNCDITMKELNTIKETIVTVFIGINHKRIAYPDAPKQDEAEAK